MHQFQGANVSVLREARQGDSGFRPGRDQVLIRLGDGTEQVVDRSEVARIRGVAPGAPVASVPQIAEVSAPVAETAPAEAIAAVEPVTAPAPVAEPVTEAAAAPAPTPAPATPATPKARPAKRRTARAKR